MSSLQLVQPLLSSCLACEVFEVCIFSTK